MRKLRKIEDQPQQQQLLVLGPMAVVAKIRKRDEIGTFFLQPMLDENLQEPEEELSEEMN